MFDRDVTALDSHQIEIRVAYQETDGQRRVHHANYLNYFERGRVEMLRSHGIRYRDLEDQGILLVIAEMAVRYHQPAEFDDLLTLETELMEIRKVRLSHRYRITRAAETIVEGWSTAAAIGPNGKPCRIPGAVRDRFTLK